MTEERYVTELDIVRFNKIEQAQNNDLEFSADSGNIVCESDATEITGDLIINSNLIVNNSVNFQDMNVFRTFDEGHTVAFGMRINDAERLELNKYDSRINKSTVMNTFGHGKVSVTNTAIDGKVSEDLDTLYSKGKRVQKPIRAKKNT